MFWVFRCIFYFLLNVCIPFCQFWIVVLDSNILLTTTNNINPLKILFFVPLERSLNSQNVFSIYILWKTISSGNRKMKFIFAAKMNNEKHSDRNRESNKLPLLYILLVELNFVWLSCYGNDSLMELKLHVVLENILKIFYSVALL